MDEVDDQALAGAFGEQPLQGVHEGVGIKEPLSAASDLHGRVRHRVAPGHRLRAALLHQTP